MSASGFLPSRRFQFESWLLLPEHRHQPVAKEENPDGIERDASDREIAEKHRLTRQQPDSDDQQPAPNRFHMTNLACRYDPRRGESRFCVVRPSAERRSI